MPDPTKPRAQIVIEPRGGDLSAVTNPTRWAALEAAALGGYITQVWVWRNGEAVVLNRSHKAFPGDWAIVIRRGLKRGTPQAIPAGSIAMAFAALSLAFRIKSGRRRPIPPDPSTPEGRRLLRQRALKRAIRRKGNQWRTLRAKPAAVMPPNKTTR